MPRRARKGSSANKGFSVKKENIQKMCTFYTENIDEMFADLKKSNNKRKVTKDAEESKTVKLLKQVLHQAKRRRQDEKDAPSSPTPYIPLTPPLTPHGKDDKVEEQNWFDARKILLMIASNRSNKSNNVDHSIITSINSVDDSEDEVEVMSPIKKQKTVLLRMNSVSLC
jgi:hypothetical protein